MLRTVLGGKIHRATVATADLHYVGSITIDEDLTRAAGTVEGEKVQVAGITDGARIETYVVAGTSGSGTICINGAAARMVNPGDKVIISYLLAQAGELAGHETRIVHVDEDNRFVRLGNDPAEPVSGSPNRVPGRGVRAGGRVAADSATAGAAR